jgi:hypothetical protein
VEDPGFFSTRQGTFQGMSAGELSFSRWAISLHAHLGNVDHKPHFQLFLMLGLGAVQALVFIGLWLCFEGLHTQPFSLAIPAQVFLPWIFIKSLITKWVRVNCEGALVCFVDNLASPYAADQSEISLSQRSSFKRN